jgi:hypothetical protein
LDCIVRLFAGGPIIGRFALIHVILACAMPFISALLVLAYKIDRKGHESNLENLGYVEESDASEEAAGTGS